MTDFRQDLSAAKVVRLNSELFPITRFEQARYDELGITPVAHEVSGDQIVRVAHDCHALVVVSESLPANVIDKLEHCRVISRLGAGTDKIDCAAATLYGIVVTNVPDFCYEEQADHAMAMLLSLNRRIPQMDAAMRRGQWDSGRNSSRSIQRFSETTLGLVGFGGSAIALARRARGFGMRVLACRQRTLDDPVAAQLNVTMTDLETLLRTADHVSLHLPLNNHTRGMFDQQKFGLMKPGACFVNTSRGAIVDEQALATALRCGHLGGAGLDVFHELNVHGPDGAPPSHPLLELDNVIVTPHVAAFSTASSRAVGTGGVDNLAAILSGYWPSAERIVNPQVTPNHPLTARK